MSRLTLVGNVRALNIALKAARTCLGIVSRFEYFMLMVVANEPTRK